MKRCILLIILTMCFFLCGCQLENNEAVELYFNSIEETESDIESYPDTSPLRDEKNYPMSVVEMIQMRKEIFSGLEEPVDNGKGYLSYPENFINDFISSPKSQKLMVAHPFTNGYEIFRHAGERTPFPFSDVIDIEASMSVLERIQNQKLKILDPPEFYKKVGAEYILDIAMGVFSEERYGVYKKTFYIDFIGNKYMKLYYSMIPEGQSQNKLVLEIYTYIYPCYVELIEPYLDKYELFQEYKESIVYMDLENAL